MTHFTLQHAKALSETSCHRRAPMLVSWGARALYIGPSLRLAAHRNAVAVLAIALDGVLELANDPQLPELGLTSCRTVLIEPNEMHLLRSTGNTCAFLYIDALSDDLEHIRDRCRVRGSRASFDLDAEELLVELLKTCAPSVAGWEACRPQLAALLNIERARPDRRIRLAVAAMAGAPGEALGAHELALAAGLSASRFQHLFKSETGVAFRHFRSWLRLRSVLLAAQAGLTLTEAALAAGFSSSAHMSTAFKLMFGLCPSQLLALRPLLIVDE